jgi:Leucine-rich repeat (LRR) protein
LDIHDQELGHVLFDRDDDGCETLMDALKGNNTLTELNFSANQFRPEFFQNLADVIPTMGALKKLDLSQNEISEYDYVSFSTAALARGLKEHATKITELNLSKNGLFDHDACSFAPALSADGPLVKLDISDNSICAAGGKALAEELRGNKVMTELNLSDNYLGRREGNWGAEAEPDRSAAAFIAISKAIPTMALVKFDISSNELQSDGAKALAEGLMNNNLMRELNIAANDITDGGEDMSGAIAIADAISTMRALVKLNMSNNRINASLNGEQAAAPGKALADALAVNTVLKELDLSNNYLKTPFAAAFAVGLGANGALEKLLMGNNMMATKEAGKALAAALAANTTLKELDVSSNNWQEYIGVGHQMGDGPGFANELADGIKNNGVLTSLDISNNQIGEYYTVSNEGSLALGTALKENSTLQELNLSSNGFHAKDAKHLADGLSTNGALTSLNISNNKIGGMVLVDGWEYKKAKSGRMAYFRDGKGQRAAPQGCGPAAVTLVDAIKNNGALASLDLSENGIPKKERRQIKKLCKIKKIEIAL